MGVIYDGTEWGRWSNFDWIMGGSDFHHCQGISFPTVLARHTAIRCRVQVLQGYGGQIPRWHDRCRAAPRPWPSRFLKLRQDYSPIGRADTGLEPRKTRNVEQETRYGRLWGSLLRLECSTGEQYAFKKPKEDSCEDGQWEIVIMKRINHVSINLSTLFSHRTTGRRISPRC
jgi:hypothetical protein